MAVAAPPQGPEAAKGQDAGSDLAKLVSINAKDAKDLQPGGTVTLPLGNIGPDFNGFSNNGNSADNTALHRPIDQAGTWGCWNFDFDGTATPNKDFCEDVKSEVKDGKQTITIKVNEKATYNDGTPIDVKAFENTWNMLKGENKDIDIVSSGAYEFVESVKAGSSDKEVVVTTTQPVYPLDCPLHRPDPPGREHPGDLQRRLHRRHAPGMDGRAVQAGPVRQRRQDRHPRPERQVVGHQAGPGKGGLPPAGEQRRDRRLQER